MAIVLTSTTEPQENLDHATSDKWEDPAAIAEFKKPVQAELPLDATPAPAITEEPAQEEKPEEVEVPEKPEEEPEKPKEAKKEPSHKLQARIDEVTKRWHVEENKSRAKDEEIAALKARLPQPEEQVIPGEPDWTTCQQQGMTWRQYLAHHHAFMDNHNKEQAIIQSRKELKDKYIAEKIPVAMKKYPDYGEVLADAKVSIPDRTMTAILKKDNSEDIVYHLAKNSDDLAALLELEEDVDQIEAIKEMSQLLAKPKEEPKKPKVVPPPPLSPVGSTATRSDVPWWERSPAESVKILNKMDDDRRKGRI